MLDGKGDKFAELFETDQRRVWVPLAEIPEYVQKAFVAAEDKRFYQHNGIDERGLIRAFIANIAEPGRPQGGSTITQQVVKNLLVGDDVSYERKIREMIVASRIDQSLSKAEILELYLNSIYLGRGAWGIEMAARSYFRKPASALTRAPKARMLAAMAKGPTYFSPDRYPERARERFAYVLKRMQEDKVAGAESGQSRRHRRAAHRALRAAAPRSGLPFRRSSDARGEDAGRHAIADLGILHGALHHQFQAAARRRGGVAGRPRALRGATAAAPSYDGPELNLGEINMRVDHRAEHARAAARPRHEAGLADRAAKRAAAALRRALAGRRGAGQRAAGGHIKVGLARRPRRAAGAARAGRARRLARQRRDLRQRHRRQEERDAQAELRIRPKVQGAAMVLENKTGRILAMVGGFSYPLSQLNRTTQALAPAGLLDQAAHLSGGAA